VKKVKQLKGLVMSNKPFVGSEYKDFLGVILKYLSKIVAELKTPLIEQVSH